MFAQKYRLVDGLEVLQRANIELLHINPDEPDAEAAVYPND